MSSYADRVGAFNEAVRATNDHVDNLKNMLQNPEVRENPVKMGLDLAGNVLGTTAGIAGVKEQMNARSLLRKTNQAFFNKIQGIGKLQADTTQGVGDAITKGLGELRDAHINNVSDMVNQNLQNLGDAAQSTASAVADTGKTAANSVQNTLASAASAAPQPRAVDDGLEEKIANLKGDFDGGLDDRIRQFPQASPSDETGVLSEANELNNTINSKARAFLQPEEFKALSSKFPQSANIKTPTQLAQMPFGDEKIIGQQNLLGIKNNMVNDAVTRANLRTQGIPNVPNPDAYDERGNPMFNLQESNPLDAASRVAVTDTSKGIASAGEAASQTLAQARNPVNLPHQGLGNVGNMADANPIQSQGEDVLNAGREAAASADQGSSIMARANSLKLQMGNIPTQDNGGTIQGLKTATGIDTQSGSANLLSQANSADSLAHQTAQSATGEVTRATNVANNAANQAAQQGLTTANSATDSATSMANKAASSGAKAAEDAGNGIKTALGVETGLDELAPETGALAPIIEAGSLLATLGTSIAGLFEPSEKKETPAPAPPPQTLSVGANLKTDASGSVGAF